MLNGIDPLWVLVDRIVSQQEKRGVLKRSCDDLVCLSCLLPFAVIYAALVLLASKLHVQL